MREFARHLLLIEPALEGAYYVDGHFVAYHGRRPVAEGWDPRRRLCAAGREDIYVHDAQARALFFVPVQPGAYLGNMLPLVVGEIKTIAPEGPWTVIFDRGGWSRHAFLEFEREGVGFITWLRGRAAKRRYPDELFEKRWCWFEGRRRTYWIYETTLALKGLPRPLRLIIYRDRKGEQIPVITNLQDASAALVILLLRIRWRQENSFKALRQDLAIDALVQHDSRVELDRRLTKNPKRESVRAALAAANDELADVESALGRALVENEESQRPSVRGLKIAHGDLGRRHRELSALVASLKQRLKGMPAKLSRSEIDPKARVAKLGHKKRIVVQVAKLAAHNGLRWLARKLRDLGAPRDETFAVLRALLAQPGLVDVRADEIVVAVHALDAPRYQRHVAALLAKLNDARAPLFGTRLPLRFQVAGQPTEKVGG